MCFVIINTKHNIIVCFVIINSILYNLFYVSGSCLECWQSFFFQIQYNFIAKCQYTDCTRNVLWCQVHSSHIHSNHKHLITAANKHPGKKPFIDKNMRKSHWHQAVHIT